eukprot:Gb_24616 [translate_table: standard]
MHGKPVTTEPTVLVVDKDVWSMLEEARLLSFFKKFSRHSESVTNQFVETWKVGRVVVNSTKILVNEALIAEVLGLPNEGEVISRDKMNQVSQLTKFIKDGEIFYWMDLGIARESLPKPWDRVAVQVMKYLTLEESSEEDRKFEDPGPLRGRSNPPKVFAAAPSGSATCPSDSLSLSKELHCHLRVLNGLGGSLTSMCACINLLTLEIINYLKEVLKYMKDMNADKE